MFIFYVPYGEGKLLSQPEYRLWKQTQLLGCDSSQDFCFQRDFGGSSSATLG